jgi:tRNA (guanine-N7-)-methyltransferase
MTGEPPRKRVLYGRRRGRKLRAGQRGLLETALPSRAILLPQSGALDPRGVFAAPPKPTSSHTSRGGEHLAAQAAAHPDVGLIGCEVFQNGVVKLLSEAERRRFENVRVFTDDARLLLARLPDASLSRVFVLFPDPWPKVRHHKRRFVSTETLTELARVLADGGELRLATDDVDYLRWMLERATVHPSFAWLARGPDDWRRRSSDWPPTRYEEKAIAAGRRPTFLRFRRRAR